MTEGRHKETRAAKVPRLSHKKSKMGCKRCKARKVKACIKFPYPEDALKFPQSHVIP
jgi:hypothetical protein